MIDRIKIVEQDLTTISSQNIINDVVYVPGFASGGSQPPRVPLLCTSIGEFKTAFGSEPAKFAEDQPYPSEFASEAIPSTTSGEEPKVEMMFKAKDNDSSYEYALALLSAGLSVVYERINWGTKDNYQDWEELVESSGTQPIAKNAIVKHTSEITVDGETLEQDEFYRCDQAIADVHTYETFPVDIMTKLSKEEVQAGGYVNDITVARMYEAMTLNDSAESGEHSIYSISIPDALSEVSTYDIKYITSGGYPTFEYSGNIIVNNMLSLAGVTPQGEGRGDAIALIDHTNNPGRPLTRTGSVYESLKTSAIVSSYGAMITPWAYYSDTISDSAMPGSFGYLLALARSLKTYPSWLPIAGIVRGALPTLQSLNTNQRLTNAVADSYQSDPELSSDKELVSMNAITYINGQGYTVWGNRTLSLPANGFATTFLNMRSLICDVKKRAFAAAQKYMFEQNTDVLWLNFKNDIQGLLDVMASGNAIRRYKIVKLATENKTKIAAKIMIMPIYAVEKFEITIIMTDTELTVADEEIEVS